MENRINAAGAEEAGEREFGEQYPTQAQYFASARKRILAKIRSFDGAPTDVESELMQEKAARRIIIGLQNMTGSEPFASEQGRVLDWIVENIELLATSSYLKAQSYTREQVSIKYMEVISSLPKSNSEKIHLRQIIRAIERKAKKDTAEAVSRAVGEYRKYLPNRKYSEGLIDFFEKEAQRLNSQKLAYENTAKVYGLNPLSVDSFLRQYRRRQAARRFKSKKK